MASPIGGGATGPSPFEQPEVNKYRNAEQLSQDEPKDYADRQGDYPLTDATPPELPLDKKIGTAVNGRDLYEDSEGMGYIFNADARYELQKEYHDDYGTFYKDEKGQFSLDHENNRNYFGWDVDHRNYENTALNAYGDKLARVEGETVYYKDSTGDEYTLTPNANANLSRTFRDSNGPYFKDGLNNRFTIGQGGLAHAFEIDNDGNRNDVATRLALDPTPFRALLPAAYAAARVDDVAHEHIEAANVPPDDNMDPNKKVDAKDISEEVKKKIKAYNEDEEAVKEINGLKKHEAKVDTVNVLIAVAVLVGVVASIALIVGTGGIAGGVIGAVAAGAMAAHQGIHGGTRAPENLSREASRAKNRMEDLIETDSQFVKNLKADDERRKLNQRDFTILSADVRKKAEAEYGGSRGGGVSYDADAILHALDDKDQEEPIQQIDPKLTGKTKKAEPVDYGSEEDLYH